MKLAKAPKIKLIGALILVLTLVGCWLYFMSTLDTRIRGIIDQNFNSKSNQPYLIQFESMDIELMDEQVKLNTVSFIPKPEVKAEIEKHDTAFKGFWLEGTSTSISLYGWSLIDLLTKTIHLDSLIIDSPEIDIQENYKLIRSEGESTSFRELSNQLVYSLKLEGFLIKNGTIKYHSSAKKSLDISLNKLQLDVQNIVVDSVKVANKTFFDADEIELSFNDLSFQSGDFKAQIESFDYTDFSRLCIQGLSVGDADSAMYKLADRKYRNPAVFIAQVDSIVLNEFNFHEVIALEKIHIAEVHLFKPVLQVFQDLGKNHDQSIDKKLPHTLLSKLEFPFQIEQLSITDGDLTFMPLGKKSRERGEIRMENIQLKTGMLSNINSDSQEYVVDIQAQCQVAKANANIHIYANEQEPKSSLFIDVDLSSFQLNDLNPIIGPVLTAQFTSGRVERLNLRTKLNQYEVFTSLDMPYSDLHLELIDAENGDTKKLLSVFSNLLVNQSGESEMIHNHITRPAYIGFLGAWWRGFQSCLVDELVIASPKHRLKINSLLSKNHH